MLPPYKYYDFSIRLVQKRLWDSAKAKVEAIVVTLRVMRDRIVGGLAIVVQLTPLLSAWETTLT